MKTLFQPVSAFRTMVLCLVLVTLVQCNRHKKVKDQYNPAFTERISAFTSGIISSESTIRIILSEDNPNAGETNSPADEDLFRFKPSIKGNAVWVDKRTIEFRPENKLISGQTYNVRFKLGKVVDVEKDLSVFEFDFTVIEQTWLVEDQGYQTHNENDLVWNRIKGVVNTADVIDNEDLKKYFTASQNAKKLKINWDPNSDRRNFGFSIDSVRRSEKESKIIISWDGNPDFPKLKSKKEIIIPSLSDYKVLDVKVVQQPDQYIRIIFSDPIKKNQAFDGLIYLDNGTALEYNVTGNIILAFPSERQNGDALLTIKGGLVNILGYNLKTDYIQQITFEVPKPAIKLTGKGVILPSSKGMIFPFEAVNLSAVDVKIIKIFENNIGHFLQVNKLDGNNELKRAGRLIHKEKIVLGNTPGNLTRWNRFYLDLAKLIEPDQGAIYRIELSFKKKYSLYPCGDNDSGGEENEEAEQTQDDDAIETESSYWDSYEEYYDYEYDYDWEERDNPCSSSYYSQSKYVARNILASDLGIIVKAGNGQSILCAVTSLITSKPMKGIEVTLYNYQQQTIGSATTDESGFAEIKTKEKPYLLIAKGEKQRGYLRLDDGSSLSLGAFDVSGKTVPKGLKAFIYGERGVWRPGDTLYLTCIVEDKLKLLPEKHPVLFELLNPKGQIVQKAVRTTGNNGFYSWIVSTPSDAITGDYTLKVKIGGTLFTKNLKIETVKPNRLKINLTFDSKQLSASKPNINGNLEVLWLHGAVAANLRSVVSLGFSKAPTMFKNYGNYQFTDPSKSFEPEEEKIFDGNTDENGKAEIPGNFNVTGNSPGMLEANFTTRVFEKSGDFSMDRLSIPYSPYSAYVGIRTPEGDKRGMLLTDTTHWVDVVLLNENGSAKSGGKLEAVIYKLNWRNWWETSDDDPAEYYGNAYNEAVFTKEVQIVNGKGRFSFMIKYPEWGRFYIRVSDPVNGHSAGKIVYIDWPGWAGRPMRDNPEAASILSFNTDKQKYNVGETAEIIIPSSGTGNALLTVESGSGILKHEWIEIKTKEMRYRLPVTEDMAPNVYIHVSLIQPHANSENDLPMRLYGVVPILVENPGTHLNPVIKMPQSLEPLQKFTVQISERDKKEMTYTLAIVEEGLLDLTRFKTPEPWNEFYAREALGVKTWDLYDMVIGAFGGKLSGIIGIGGDEEVKGEGSAEKANRFKPVVKFVGPFTLKEGKVNSHTFTMPNYVGSVRAMVVAGHKEAYGTDEKTVPVKKPLMVLATLPRVLGPNESVKLPVTVFAMEKSIQDVSIKISTNGLILTEGEIAKTINFSKTGEKIVMFDLKIASRTGMGKVNITASSGRNTSNYSMELDIRNANPPVATFTGDVVEQGKSKNFVFELPGVAGSNTATLEVSNIPPIDAGRRLRYLIAYPHGCVEQVTSSVFPQLFLPDVMELSENNRASIDVNIKAGIQKLRHFQQAGGEFSYWPGQYDFSSWGSSYAGHFLLEAEKKGYSLPSGLKSAWLKSQKRYARQWSGSSGQGSYLQDDLEQAYRLYTLALAGEPETGAMNRLRESGKLSPQAKWRLAAAYALSGQIPVAQELIARENTDVQPYNGLYSSYGSRERDWAMYLETVTLIQEKNKGAVLAKRISEALSSSQWMSTQTTAYCLLAMSKFAMFNGRSSKQNFSYSLNNSKSVDVVSQKNIIQVPLKISNGAVNGSITLNNKGNSQLFVRVLMEGIPEAGQEKEFSNNLNLTTEFYNEDGEILDIANLSQGIDFIAKIVVHNPSALDYKNLALTQIFPPGWEISNTRIWQGGDENSESTFTYQDIRDDRVYTYFDLKMGETKTFIVKLSATYLGKYYLSGPYCEAMYDNSISALKRGKWIEINAGN